MARFILVNSRFFLHGTDFTSAANKIEISHEVEDKDVTNFASGGAKEVIGGLSSTTVDASGWWEAGSAGLVDDALWAGAGGLSAWTICPDGATVGSVAWLSRAVETSYQLGGAVGDVAPWTATTTGTWPLVRGVIAHLPGTARTSNGTGVAQQMGAIVAGQHLYAALHVVSIAGSGTPSITVELESDDAAGFTSPTSRGSFTAATAVSGQIIRIPGPIADTHWRLKWTITGTTPSFLFVVSFGVK